MVREILPFYYRGNYMKLIEVSDKYINYMKQFFYSTMLDNKENVRKHSRKYLGIIITINNINYFAPLSSPKKSDYDEFGGIRKSSSIVLRMVKDYSRKPQLLDTIKLNNMIPVPNSEITLYDLNNELDIKYKNLIIDELDWIQQNTNKILKAANAIYFFKTHEDININSKNEKYLNSIMPFKLAEVKYLDFITKYSN